ncbi:MAG: CotH kinase family protein [Lachnospiraceae bacterium]|nr:CotH kinase family protein [Lachnospiraceae bacterium]
MKRRTVFLFAAVLTAIIVIAATGRFDAKTARARQTLDMTDEQILAQPYFDVMAAAGENHNLECDVVSYSLGDGYVHLILPENVPADRVACYIRDQAGNYLARRVYDFTQPVMIGAWQIVLERHDLPIIYFESDDPAVFPVMCADKTKSVICDGTITVYAGDDHYGLTMKSIASLQGRGSSSWERCDTKKSFTLSTDHARDLLGLGSNRNWNLIGNAYDASLLKCTVFNDISNAAGIEFQPRMSYANLYVDGIYQGVYTLTTKVSVNRNRVDLSNGDFFYRKQPSILTQPIAYDSITQADEGDESDYPVVDLLYPENASEAELEEAAAIFQNFIDNVEDPSSEDLSKVCDIRSLARYYWIQEASMNFDAWGRSVYMYYKKDDGKVHMGPVWDMDLTLGSPFPKKDPVTKELTAYDTPEGWKIRLGGWYKHLFENEEFVRAVEYEYMNGGVREALWDGLSDFEARWRELGDDAYTNYLLFGHSNMWEALINYGDTYDEYTDNMTQFYRQRLEWIDRQMQ